MNLPVPTRVVEAWAVLASRNAGEDAYEAALELVAGYHLEDEDGEAAA